MSTELYRKYIDIINENSQDKIQLDEGIMDKLKLFAQKLIGEIGGDADVIANAVSKATGGDFTVNRDNVQKVIRALQLDNMDFDDGTMAGSHLPMNEGKLADIVSTVFHKALGLLVAGGGVGAMAAAFNPGSNPANQGKPQAIMFAIGAIMIIVGAIKASAKGGKLS